MTRIKEHQSLDLYGENGIVFFNGQEYMGYEGETIAAAPHAAGKSAEPQPQVKTSWFSAPLVTVHRFESKRRLCTHLRYPHRRVMWWRWEEGEILAKLSWQSLGPAGSSAITHVPGAGNPIDRDPVLGGQLSQTHMFFVLKISLLPSELIFL